jgi:hypothetical protein
MLSKNERFVAPDMVKSFWLLGIIIVHSTIFCFDGIYRMDLDNPPISMVIFSVLTYWGAMFTIIACWLHTYHLFNRNQEFKDLGRQILGHTSITAGFLMIIHFLSNVVFGVLVLDFDSGQHDHTVVTGLFRDGNLSNLSWHRFFEGSTFSTIAFGLLAISGLFYLVKKLDKEKIFAPLAYGLSWLFLLTGILRIWWYPAVLQAYQGDQYWLSLIFSLFLEKPYPLLPYLSFAFVGGLIGYSVWKQWKFSRILLVLGSYILILIPVAVVFILNNEISIAAVDWFWFGRLMVELVVFLVSILVVLGIFRNRTYNPSEANLVLKTGQLIAIFSLTIYLFQPLVSELNKLIWNLFSNTWSYDVNLTIGFGFFNVLIWLLLVWLIWLFGKNLTFERLWLMWYNVWNRPSRKSEYLQIED